MSVASGIASFAVSAVNLIAGTAWLFAREELEQAPVDYLFIDEAGQVSLANALAMGTSARNLIFLGDALQLAQVTQGTHPPGSGASVLEHLLGDAPTIPPDRGIFLESTYRMHPDITAFVSEIVYEGRLRSAEECTRQGTSFGTGAASMSGTAIYSAWKAHSAPPHATRSPTRKRPFPSSTATTIPAAL